MKSKNENCSKKLVFNNQAKNIGLYKQTLIRSSVPNSGKLVTKSGKEREKDGILRMTLESDFDVGKLS